jgi:hypothetical protein
MSTGQCAKSKLLHRWAMIQGPLGSDHGRCAVTFVGSSVQPYMEAIA